MPTILGIESTCDETAAAVVIDGVDVRSNVIATQYELHAKFRGVVPEIASRAHIENILPVLREAIDQAGCKLGDLDAVAVAYRPGLIGSLLIGVTAAKTLAWSLGKPLIAIDHVHAHLYSVMLGEMQSAERGMQSTERRVQNGETDRPSTQHTTLSTQHSPAPAHSAFCTLHSAFPTFPAVGLVCSGGHTALYHLRSWVDVELIGSTIDDAVGEAYDKVAAILGLGYPGGPIIDALAAGGDPAAVKFPRTLLDRDSLDFSFSGLKTSVLYHVRGVPGRKEGVAQQKTLPSEQETRDIAASFQAACVDVILKKIRRAIVRTRAKSVIIGGGVSANRGLRAALSRFDVPVFFPPLKYCTDNAAMTAGLAHLNYERNDFAKLDVDAITYSQFRRPNLKT